MQEITPFICPDDALQTPTNTSPSIEKQPPKIRRDIQSLRAIAVLSVFLFHLWPKTFSNGFLGVDIFFAISGYLMAQIYSNDQAPPFQRVSNFYQRRIRRIVPVYLLVLCVVVYAGSLILTNDDFGILCQDTMSSLVFVTNIQNMIGKTDYWAQVSTYRIVLHTWSLAVEIQFYILFPFIIHILLKIESKRNKLVATGTMALLSLALQLYSNSTVAFNLVFARMWQFFGGIISFLYTDSDENRTKTIASIKPLLQLALVIFVLVFPWSQDWRTFSQVTTIIATSILLACNSNEKKWPASVIENDFVIKLGDLSYVWYLVHWPVIEFWLYWSPFGVVRYADGLVITALILAVVLIVDQIDNLLRQLINFQSIVLLICFFYAFIFAFIFHDRLRFGYVTQETIRDSSTVIDLNATLLLIDNLNRADLERRRTILAKLKGSGKLRALVIGNSHASVSFDVVARTFARHFNTIHLFWTTDCVPIRLLSTGGRISCLAFVAAVIKVIENEQPGIVFLHFRWWSGMDMPISQPPEADEIVVAFRNLILKIEKYAKIIYIGEPGLEFKYPIAKELAKRLEQGISLTELNKKLTNHNKQRQFSYERLLIVEKNCSKCVAMRWTEVFCNSSLDLCCSFDEESQLAYFRDQHHWSQLGRLKVEPYLKNLSNQLETFNFDVR